jgi:CRP/FNR family transcriptional regulator
MILTSEAKVAKIIIEHGELFETLKNTQIASILNITPETLSRILTRFKKTNLIAVEKNHHINIKDPVKLTSIFE